MDIGRLPPLELRDEPQFEEAGQTWSNGELGLVVKLVQLEERGPNMGLWRARRLGGMTGGAVELEGEEGLFYWLLCGFSAIAGWERIEL